MDAVVDPGRSRLWTAVPRDVSRRQVELARRVLRGRAAIVVDAAGDLEVDIVDAAFDQDLLDLCAHALEQGDTVGRTGAAGSTHLAAPIIDDAGEMLGAVGVSRDASTTSIETDRAMLAAVAGSLADLAAAGLRLRAMEDAEALRAAAVIDTNHELRTPLQAIVGFTEFLKTETRPHLIRAHARTIQAAANAVLTIINQSLDEAAPTEVAASEPSLVAIRPFAETCLSLVGPAALEKCLESRLVIAEDVPLCAHLDRQKVMQALLNLLNNAVKFTDRGGFTLEIQATAQRLRFNVCDTGIGIADDEVDRLFKRFSRLGQEEREIDGTGLGLAITKGLVETMGGTVGVASTSSGSTFWFELPVASDDEENADAHEPSPVPTATSRPVARILLADDLDLNRKLIADMLAIDGHAVDSVCDGAAAVEAVQAHAYELVLMDMIMPVMDGLTAARAIRALPAPACHVPILALTANCADDQLQACLDAGMDATLTKPMTFDGLSATVAHWLGRRREAA